MKQNKSRNNQRANAHRKQNGTSEAVADALDSPRLTLEALVGVKLRQM